MKAMKDTMKETTQQFDINCILNITRNAHKFKFDFLLSVDLQV